LSRLIAVDTDGTLRVPADVLEQVEPHAQYLVSARGNVIVLEPVASPAPFWATAGPQERANDLMRWAARHTDGPSLPSEALRRESFYD
jgi:hypothetical protein